MRWLSPAARRDVTRNGNDPVGGLAARARALQHIGAPPVSHLSRDFHFGAEKESAWLVQGLTSSVRSTFSTTSTYCPSRATEKHHLRDVPVPARPHAEHPHRRLCRRPAPRRHRGRSSAAGRAARPVAQSARMGRVAGRAGSRLSDTSGASRRGRRNRAQDAHVDEPLQRSSDMARRRARGPRRCRCYRLRLADRHLRRRRARRNCWRSTWRMAADQIFQPVAFSHPRSLAGWLSRYSAESGSRKGRRAAKEARSR